ncbi:MAG: hypothetical protein HY075_14045 [Deltaproteobacteria bacterium]|nr:hypothetical protein [Deltaproteobacteria bacterium]
MKLALAFASIVLFLALVRVASAASPSSGLFVVFDVDGQRYRAPVSRVAEPYVRAFVRGEATHRVPPALARSWLRVAGVVARPASVRVASAEECSAGQCVRLRGLYAGRSPTF